MFLSIRFSRRLLLCALIASGASAIAAPALPTAADLQGVMTRILEAELAEQASSASADDGFSRAYKKSLMRSLQVEKVQGCVAGDASALTCVAQVDWGRGKQLYTVLSVLRQGKTWEASPAQLKEGSAKLRLAPTVAQAQAAAREAAKAQLDESGPDGKIEVYAAGLKVLSISDECEFDKRNGSVACEAAFQLPATKTSPEQQYTKRSHFYLDGGAWRFGRGASSEE